MIHFQSRFESQSERENHFENLPKNSTTNQTRVQHFLKIKKILFLISNFLSVQNCTFVCTCIGFEFPGNEEKPNFEP